MESLNIIANRFKNNMFWRSVAVLVSGTAMAQAIGLLTTPIVSRLYAPTAFGQYAIIVSTATIIINIATLGLDSAVMVPECDDECDDVFMVAFFTMLFLSTFILVVMITISPIIKLFNSGMNYIISCLLVYLFVIINNLIGLLSIYINRKSLNRIMFFNSVIGAFATLFITIPMGIFKFGSLGLIIASIMAGVVSIGQMLYHTNPFKKVPKIVTFINVYKKYKDFILFQYPSNFVENFAIQLPIQVLSARFGSVNLGAYNMNEKLLGIPSRLLGAPINKIYFRTASEYFKEGKDLAKFTFSLVTKIMIGAFLPTVILVLWGEHIFEWALGKSWSQAGKLSSFLILQYVFMFCQICTSYCRVAIGKQKTNLVVSVLRLVIVGVSLSYGIYSFGNLINTIIVFTIGSSIYLIIDMAINFYCMGRYWLRYTILAVSYFCIISLLWIVAN